MVVINGNAPFDEKEMSAYIQQQISDLEPHLKTESPLELKLTQVDEGFEAELTADHESGVVQTLGWNENIFSAIKSAKEGLLEYFIEVEQEKNPQHRNEQIDHISRHGNLYLH
ncbi:MAG: hypothetical protein HRT44_01975 [Bdellovibrionales bacterium]|nr:hypothetical protein [Bdellovibrionales bacterium]NQZ18015.1 hypothetical protein [Bdellovibrionales bacterium]